MCYHNLRNTKVERGETMFTVNVNKLNGKIHERGFNKSSFSKERGIDRNTLSSYLNNPKKIPYDVIDKMASILCVSEDEASEIFFTNRLS